MKKITTILVSLIVAGSVLGVFPYRGIEFRQGKLVVYEICLMAVMALIHFKNTWVKLFMLYILFGALFFYRYPMQVSGRATLLTHLTLWTIFITLSFYETIKKKITEKHFDLVLDIICAITAIHALWLVMHYFGLFILIIPKDNFISDTVVKGLIYVSNCPHEYPFTGLLSNRNMAAALLAIGLPAFFRKKWWIFVPMILFCLYLVNCFGGTIPAVVAILMLLWRKNKLGALISFLFVASLGLLTFKTRIFSPERWEVWSIIVHKLVKIRPCVGFGLGQFKMLFPIIHRLIFHGKFSNQLFYQAHNEYLQTLIEIGGIGLSIAVTFAISLYYKALKYKNEIAFIALMGITACLLNAGVNFLFHTTTGLLFFLYAALIENQGGLKCQEIQ